MTGFMKMDFFKYQGAGNDFIMIDDRAGRLNLTVEQIAAWCHRRFGIGADGLIILRSAPGYDFGMVYFNADGNEGSMCGNGGRCVVRFALDLGIFEKETSFLAFDGPHTASVCANGDIRLKMGAVSVIEERGDAYFLNTGSPHFVTYVPDVDATDVVGLGREIRYGNEYGPQGGTNVNFVQVMGDRWLKVRTYERGVEDETYACGTGATACALTAFSRLGWKGPVKISVVGGELEVDFQAGSGQAFSEVYLTGPAKYVFRGTLNL